MRIRKLLPTVERVEPRIALATFTQGDPGLVTLIGDAATTGVSAIVYGQNVTLSNPTPGRVAVLVPGKPATLLPTGIRSVYLHGTAGNDRLDNEQGVVPVVIHAGAGADTVKSGSYPQFVNWLYGDEGPDTLIFDPNTTAGIEEPDDSVAINDLPGDIPIVYFYGVNGDTNDHIQTTVANGRPGLFDQVGGSTITITFREDQHFFIIDTGTGNDIFTNQYESTDAPLGFVILLGPGDDTVLDTSSHGRDYGNEGTDTRLP